ncbi:hypothetical protein SXCC_01244 [Gluconacetobacter sp. SXCC-1]|nr:hypothetical protein SXCC_01244 [Gluconacetobacter sp. SXCC-1]
MARVATPPFHQGGARASVKTGAFHILTNHYPEREVRAA